MDRKILENEGKIAEIRKYGYMQNKVLKYLYEIDHANNGYQQNEIARSFGISVQQARLILMSLVKKNLVIRMEHPTKKMQKNSDGTETERIYYGIFYMANKPAEL